MTNHLLTPRQAYLAMCEFLRKECELNNWKPVDVRGLLAELELEGEWVSADPGSTFQFEEAIEKVLNEGSHFDRSQRRT